MSSDEKQVCKTSDRQFVPPSSKITEEMVRFAQTDDLWHFAVNLNTLMKLNPLLFVSQTQKEIEFGQEENQEIKSNRFLRK